MSKSLPNKGYQFIPVIYGIVCVTEIIGEIISDQLAFHWVKYLTKPLLMPILIFWLFKTMNYKLNVYQQLIASGLIFSCLGDVFLMFDMNELFIFGLGSFFITHILYIVGFIHSNKNFHTPWSARLFFALPFVGFTYMFIRILSPYILSSIEHQALFIPVVCYASIIALMGIAATWRISISNKDSYYFILYGALLFVASDSMIAINKFISPLPWASILIMVTYMTAQFLIVKGSMRQTSF
jgi:uncharacterized membrane protein YhhN